MTQLEKNPNPTKDQHFMVDESMLERIYRKANIKEGETIVEVGGGAGALTKYLASGNNHITVIEKDPYYAKLLREKFSTNSNVEVVEGDALQFDFYSFDRIVANLPYTITEPFLINLARTGTLGHTEKDPKSSNVKSITLVLSQNSVRKMVAPVQIIEGNSKHCNQEFGLMGAICHTFLNLEIDTVIPSEAFFPEPAVTSLVVNLTPKRKKTTVDRIMAEILTDKKGNLPAINRIYQMMLAQGKVYNINKYKNLQTQAFRNFTSKTIGDKNVYELTNMQLSQLVQDLIRNDAKVKGSRTQARQIRYDDLLESYKRFGILDDEMEDDELQRPKTKGQKKSEEKYAYLFDSRAYNVLLKRGLENIKHNEFLKMLEHGI